MKMIKALMEKYRELIVYVLFGLCNTVVNLGCFKLLNMALGEEKYLISNAIAWFITVCFAYVTNKIWVFESKSWEPKVFFKEVTSFFAARVLSFLVEEFGLFFFVDTLNFREYSVNIFFFEISGEMISKAVLAVFVVVLNYVFSKMFIFKKKDKGTEHSYQDTAFEKEDNLKDIG